MPRTKSRAPSIKTNVDEKLSLIKTIDSTLTPADWRDLIRMLAARSRRPDIAGMRAAELLLRYRFGPPPQATKTDEGESAPVHWIRIEVQAPRDPASAPSEDVEPEAEHDSLPSIPASSASSSPDAPDPDLDFEKYLDPANPLELPRRTRDGVVDSSKY